MKQGGQEGGREGKEKVGKERQMKRSKGGGREGVGKGGKKEKKKATEGKKERRR